jgi:hydrogenase nickel incorporation protein HypA/HybF
MFIFKFRGGAAVHELSIAQCVIDEACEAAARAGSVRVTKLMLRIGALSGVVDEALRFSFEVAAEGTACQGAALEIERVDLRVMCTHCEKPSTISDGFSLICPECGSPTPEILAGQELELTSLEIVSHAAADSRATHQDSQKE